MATKTIFLSHIHEERELAGYFKAAIETEFSGFVDVFVSSDGVSIPAGVNFLRRIEDKLTTCVGALYLISPKSVNRNWINFELGAIWIRSSINVRNGQDEIPTIPICHSGMEPSLLPNPISGLNAVRANEAAGVSFALKSLQAAAGGRGPLKTDLAAFVADVSAFERRNTIEENILRALQIMVGERGNLEGIKAAVHAMFVTTPRPCQIDFGEIQVDSAQAPALYRLVDESLKQIFWLEGKGVAMGFRDGRPAQWHNIHVRAELEPLATTFGITA